MELTESKDVLMLLSRLVGEELGRDPGLIRCTGEEELYVVQEFLIRLADGDIEVSEQGMAGKVCDICGGPHNCIYRIVSGDGPMRYACSMDCAIDY